MNSDRYYRKLSSIINNLRFAQIFDKTFPSLLVSPIHQPTATKSVSNIIFQSANNYVNHFQGSVENFKFYYEHIRIYFRKYY